MDHCHGDTAEPRAQARLGLRGRIALAGFGAVAAFFLWTEHRAHVIAFLPWALLALCPLMHLFMHGGHDHGGHRPGGDSDNGDPQQHQRRRVVEQRLALQDGDHVPR